MSQLAVVSCWSLSVKLFLSLYLLFVVLFFVSLHQPTDIMYSIQIVLTITMYCDRTDGDIFRINSINNDLWHGKVRNSVVWEHRHKRINTISQ